MLKNYLKIAFRNFIRKKLFSLINILGFTAAISSSLLIFLWVGNELNYDRFNKNYDRIYKLEETDNTMMAPGVKKLLSGKISGIKEVVRFKYWKRDCLLQNKKSSYLVTNLAYADKNLFDVFTFKFLEGNPKYALTDPNSIVLTKSISKILFGNGTAAGKFIRFNNNVVYKVTEVIEDVNNSHLPVTVFASYSTLEKQNRYYADNLYGTEFPTYILLNKDASPIDIEEQINNFLGKYPHWSTVKPAFHLTPLKDIYFSERYEYEEWTIHGNKTMVYVFMIVAFIIILIAMFNYLNLTIAFSTLRNKEVAVRKIVGASKKELFFQFISESVLTCLISLFAAIVLVELILPILNNLFNESLNTSVLFSAKTFAGIIISVVIVGIVGGIYPAVILSSMRPAIVVKLNKVKGSKAVLLRNSLVIIQFVASIILISGSIIIHKQMNFIKNKDLGFDKTNIVNIQLNTDLLKKKEIFKEELLKIPGVKSVAFSHELLGVGWWQADVKYKDEMSNMAVTTVDPDFLETFGIKLIKGRNFSWIKTTDQTGNGNSSGKFIVNQTALKMLGGDKLLGQEISLTDWGKGTIIGVVKDFNFKSLHSKLEPLILCWDKEGHHLASIKILSNKRSQTLNGIKEVYQSLFPVYPFTYKYLDDFTAGLYKKELKFGNLITVFTVLSILICCLGIFGIITFIIDRKIKEIGIRKILGAGIPGLVIMLSKDFIKWVVFASLLAWPAIYFIMNSWLQNFVYRINIGWWVFVLAGGIALLIALVTVSFQAIKAATANPVKSLRYE